MERREDRPDDHRGAAPRTGPRGAGWRVAGRSLGRVGGWRRRGGCGEEGPRQGHAGGPAGVREESGLPDTPETAREHVLDETAEKLHRGQRQGAALVATGVVLVGNGHVFAVEGEEPVIADRDSMGIAPEIAQDGGRAPEGRLGVDDPVRLEEGVDEGPPLRRVTPCGSVKTTCTYGTSSSSRSRAWSQRSRPCAWHFGQCRFRHEL